MDSIDTITALSAEALKTIEGGTGPCIDPNGTSGTQPSGDDGGALDPNG
jgi:hypothetical protein